MIEMPDSGPAATGLDDLAPTAAPVPPSPSQRGKRLLIGLFAVAIAVAVAAAAVTAVLLAQHLHRPHAADHPLRATVFGLRPGQCFDSLPNGIAGAHAVPCAQPHDAEVYGVFSVAGHRWPGTVALGSQARLGCQRRLAGYLNPQLASTSLAETYVYPNAGAWAAGEHMVICEIRGTRGKLTGSVRAAGG
jgi:hypothetical protein